MKTLIILMCFMTTMTAFGNTSKSHQAVRAQYAGAPFNFKSDGYFRVLMTKFKTKKEKKSFPASLLNTRLCQISTVRNKAFTLYISVE